MLVSNNHVRIARAVAAKTLKTLYTPLFVDSFHPLFTLLLICLKQLCTKKTLFLMRKPICISYLPKAIVRIKELLHYGNILVLLLFPSTLTCLTGYSFHKPIFPLLTP